MKRSLLVFALVLFLVSPVWGGWTGEVPTKLDNFEAQVGKITYHEGDVVVVPAGEDVMFKVKLTGLNVPGQFRHVHFSFYDEDGELVYHERDTTNVDAVAQVKIPDGKKIKEPGKYTLEMKYNGSEHKAFAPCSLGPITVVFE